MSTRSYIVRKTDEGYEGVYCHWDGYPDYNGIILADCYSDEAKLADLISLGDISSLGQSIGQQHSFDDRPEGVTTFYGRDRGEKNIEPRHYSSLDELFNAVVQTGCEFVYIYDGFWLFAERGPQYFGMSDGSTFSELKPLWSVLSPS